MFDDIIHSIEDTTDEILFDMEKMTCENCNIASYILSNYPGTKVLCQKTGFHMDYKDWCEKWEERTRVKPH